jgi:hypothetical protein
MRIAISVSTIAVVLGACSPQAAPGDAAMDADVPLDAETDAARPSPADEFTGPPLLSETGLYADLSSGTLAEGVMPYRVRFELWSDGAEKQRWFWLPPGTRIDTSDPDRWQFPVGTRAWKEFRVGGVRVETRFLYKAAPDRWENVAYVWRPDGSDADARPEGVVDAFGTMHDVPDTRGCFDCHRGADGLIGIGAIQLSTGEPDDLLARLIAADLLTTPIDPAPSIPGSTLDQEALGYLHANCGHCHDDAHPLGAVRTLRMRLPLGLSDPLDAPAYTTAVGVEMQHTIHGTTIGIVAGDAAASQIYARMIDRDGFAMPPRGTELVDPNGSELIRAWIDSLPTTLP